MSAICIKRRALFVSNMEPSQSMEWKTGDLIMKSKPYAHVLCNKYREERCSYCFLRQENVKKCTACGVLRYCGRICQREDWTVHRVECKCLPKITPNIPTDSVMLMLRLLVKHQQGEHIKVSTDGPCQRSFEHLMSHVEDIKQDVERCDAFSKVVFTLSQLSGDHLPLPDMKTLLQIFGQMVVNTFTIADEELKDIGSGIYLGASILDHCCTPNAVVTFQGTSLNVRAVQDIPPGPLSQLGDRVFISYVDQLAPSWERLQQLQHQYYFTCKCGRCQDTHLDELMTSGNIPLGDQGCDEVTVKVKAANQICQTAIEKVDGIKKSSDDPQEILELCRSCLAKVNTVLSPTNVFKLRVLDCAFDAAVACASWDAASEFGLPTLQPYRDLLPPYSPTFGLQLMRVGKLHLFLDRIHEAHAFLSQAEQIISVTHGRDGDLYKQLVQLEHQTSTELRQAAIQ